jgi:FG-GAP repeat
VSLLLLGAWLASAHAEHSLRAPTGASARATAPPAAALPAAAQAQAARGQISASLGADDPAYRVHRLGPHAFRALSAPQRLSARFASSGVTLRSGDAKLGLRLSAFGFGGSLHTPDAVAPRAAANRITYVRRGLTEWYANGPLGIEQGFTVERPSATPAGARLQLRLAVSGDERAALAEHGAGVVLRGPGGHSLRYGAVSASDAAGRELPSKLVLRGRTIVLLVDTTGARFPLTVDPLVEQESPSPTPSEVAEEPRFGFSIALSADGTTALVAGPGDAGLSGAAWVFTRAGTTWTQQGPKLTAPESLGQPEEPLCAEEADCGFGRSVALSADGDTALIGAPRANESHGAAWVFTRSGSTWSQFGHGLAGGNASFGRSVALSADGTTALVGAPSQRSTRGAAWTFTRSASGFVAFGEPLTTEATVAGDFFGRSVALSANGTTALVGAPGEEGLAGAAWAFARAGEGWIGRAKLTGAGEAIGEARFGASVALSASGETALIGARTDDEGVGSAWPFIRNGSAWAQQGPKLSGIGELGEGQFGASVALSADGDTALVGAPHDNSGQGAAWELTRTGASWASEGEQVEGGAEPGKDLFGAGIALSADAGTALIGAPRASHRLGNVWTLFGPVSSVPPVPPVPPANVEKEINPSPNSTSTTETTTTTARSGALASTTTALPPPRLALTGNVIPESGIVRVKLPGAKQFTLLSEGAQIPFGSIVDATHGRVSVITADAHGALQTTDFYEGEFKLTQHRDGLVVSILFGGNFSKCPTALQRRDLASSSAARGKHTVRKLWAEGHGRYSTKGNYATGAVLGTRWLTADLCEGTLIRVLTDKVAVKNLVTGKQLTVTAGHSYLAAARRKHGAKH